MPLRQREGSRDKLLLWTFGLGLILVLTGLFVATSESLKHQEHGIPFTGAVEPDLPLADSNSQRNYHDPSLAGWPVP